MKVALIGTQWGDEGKGKLVSSVLKKHGIKINARYNGGRNAGHTVVNENGREIGLHLVPTGIIYPNVYNVLLSGVYVDPLFLVEEIESLRELGYEVNKNKFGISDRAHVTLDYHFLLEDKNEADRGEKKIGTTRRGIGPTAVDKYDRRGIRFAEFLNEFSFEEILEENLEQKSKELGVSLSYPNYILKYQRSRDILKEFLMNEQSLKKEKGNLNWLFEGAQGILLGIEGTYHYVTSSHPELIPARPDLTYGVMKAYNTRVGEGPLITEIRGEVEEILRGSKETLGEGVEYGATTGRARRCGWFDAVAANYALSVCDIDNLIITKLDRLSAFEEIQICDYYEYYEKKLSDFPSDRLILEKCKPHYITVKGWKKPREEIQEIRTFNKLPPEAQAYLKKLAKLVGKSPSMVSVGPKGEEIIEIDQSII